jgi:hypothetical protein
VPPPGKTGLQLEAEAANLPVAATVAAVVAEILASAIATDPDLPTPERLATFVRVVGAEDLRSALATTAQRLERHTRGEASPVAHPWEYVVAVVNGRPARLRYLYLLLYLWETSLRTRIDLVLTAAKGPEWFREPSNYLVEAGVLRMLSTQKSVRVVVDAGPPAVYGINPGITSGQHFLRELDLSTLHDILLDSWQVFGPMLKGQWPATMPIGSARGLLDTIYRARYLVTHMQRLDNAAFARSTERLRNALGRIEVNVDKALARIGSRDPAREDFELFLGEVLVERPAAEPVKKAKD